MYEVSRENGKRISVVEEQHGHAGWMEPARFKNSRTEGMTGSEAMGIPNSG
jgi:hypothetical protein